MTAARHRTTDPGYTNSNGQMVLARTGFRSDSRDGQVIYRMRCTHCAHEYGSNGCDIHSRRCPRHQNGAAGEILREASPKLFEELSI